MNPRNLLLSVSDQDLPESQVVLARAGPKCSPVPYRGTPVPDPGRFDNPVNLGIQERKIPDKRAVHSLPKQHPSARNLGAT